MPCFSVMNTYNTKTPTIENYDEYKHAGVTDKQIQEKYSMNDTELDKLIFTNYEKFKLVMENNSQPQRKKKKKLETCTHIITTQQLLQMTA